MILNEYRVEIRENGINVLVKDSEREYDRSVLNTPEEFAKMMVNVFGIDKKAEEYLYMIAFNTKAKIIGIFEVSHGCVDGAICDIPCLLKRALLCGSKCFLLVHNHPSGEVDPSKEDIKTTKEVSKAGRVIGIQLVDHIIVGRNGKWFSLNDYCKE